MRRRILGRLVFALILVVIAFAGVYVLTDLAPGDAADDHMQSSGSLQRQRQRLGLEASLPSRLATRLTRLAVLDLGTSIRYEQPVLTLVTQRATATLQAGLSALLLALLLGVPAGVMASRSPSRLARHAIAAVSIFLLSLAGVPPLSGFLGKLAIVQGAFGAGAYGVGGLVLVVGLLTLISMARTWSDTFWKPDTGVHDGATAATPLLVTIALLNVITVAMTVGAEPLFALATRGATELLQRDAYIRAVLGGAP